MKFLADNMLGRLSRWLRILGYDTFLASDHGFEDDAEIAETASREGRILLTRDRQLAQRSGGILLRSDDLLGQLKELYAALHIRLDMGDNPRCPLCNCSLRIMDQEEAEEAARQNKYISRYYVEIGSEFWVCTCCERVYWQGSHWEDIEAKLKAVRERGS